MHQQRAREIGQDGFKHDAARRRAQRTHRLDIILRAHRQHAGIGDAGEARHENEGKDRNERRGTRPDQRHRQQQRRKAEQRIHRAHRHRWILPAGLTLSFAILGFAFVG